MIFLEVHTAGKNNSQFETVINSVFLSELLKETIDLQYILIHSFLREHAYIHYQIERLSHLYKWRRDKKYFSLSYFSPFFLLWTI